MHLKKCFVLLIYMRWVRGANQPWTPFDQYPIQPISTYPGIFTEDTFRQRQKPKRPATTAAPPIVSKQLTELQRQTLLMRNRLDELNNLILANLWFFDKKGELEEFKLRILGCVKKRLTNSGPLVEKLMDPLVEAVRQVMQSATMTYETAERLISVGLVDIVGESLLGPTILGQAAMQRLEKILFEGQCIDEELAIAEGKGKMLDFNWRGSIA